MGCNIVVHTSLPQTDLELKAQSHARATEMLLIAGFERVPGIPANSPNKCGPCMSTRTRYHFCSRSTPSWRCYPGSDETEKTTYKRRSWSNRAPNPAVSPPDIPTELLVSRSPFGVWVAGHAPTDSRSWGPNDWPS